MTESSNDSTSHPNNLDVPPGGAESNGGFAAPIGYQAFVGGEAFVVMDQISVLRITGNDCVAVLNNLCTADIKRLPRNKASELFVTDVRGKAIGHLYALNLDQSLMLVGNRGQGAIVSTHVDRYIIREDAHIDDLSDSVSAVLLSGHTRSQHLALSTLTPDGGADVQSANVQSANVNSGDEGLLPLACGALPQAPCETTWVNVRWTSPRDTLLLTSSEHLQRLVDWLTEQGYASASAQAFETARIEAAWPVFGVDCDNSNLPQEIDRDAAAISFNKGCYLGQETIARLDALGQVQRKLVQVRITGDAYPPPGTSLMNDDKVCGQIRSVTWSPAKNTLLGLAFVRRRWFNAGSILDIADTSQTATVE